MEQEQQKQGETWKGKVRTSFCISTAPAKALRKFPHASSMTQGRTKQDFSFSRSQQAGQMRGMLAGSCFAFSGGYLSVQPRAECKLCDSALVCRGKENYRSSAQQSMPVLRTELLLKLPPWTLHHGCFPDVSHSSSAVVHCKAKVWGWLSPILSTCPTAELGSFGMDMSLGVHCSSL